MVLPRSFLLTLMFQTTRTQKIKAHILCLITLSRKKKTGRLWNGMEKKYGTAKQATDDNMAHAQCMLNNYGYTKLSLSPRIRNTYCSSTSKIVTRTRLIIMFIRTLSVVTYSTSSDVCPFHFKM